MNEIVIYGLIGLAALAVMGLGIKVAINLKGGVKNNLKNVTIHGPYAGRDIRELDNEQDKGK
jgi:hypothetical protein